MPRRPASANHASHVPRGQVAICERLESYSVMPDDVVFRAGDAHRELVSLTMGAAMGRVQARRSVKEKKPPHAVG